MHYRLLGWLDAHVAHALRPERGQGTVEYVGLLMLLATLLLGFVLVGRNQGKDIAHIVVEKLKETVESLKPAK